MIVASRTYVRLQSIMIKLRNSFDGSNATTPSSEDVWPKWI